jgi:hypothetical protein
MGKTAVFVIAVLEQLKDSTEDAGVQALVIAHTRELAHQISSEFERFIRHMENVRVGVFFGGIPIAQDQKALKTPPKIVIGTPGRIKQLVTDGSLDLKNLKHFVLDECDRCLETLGKFLEEPYPSLNCCRYEKRRPSCLPKDPSSKAGDDVLRHSQREDPTGLQEVHEKRRRTPPPGPH